MRILIGLAACVLIVAAVRANQPSRVAPSSYTNATQGFSLEPPAFPKAGKDQGTLVATFLAPASDGFASNLNVQVLPFKGTTKAFREQNVAELKKAGLKLNSEKMIKQDGHDAWSADYQGKVQNRDLRFLATAVFDGDRLILLTCTARADQFAAVEPAFRASLESFKIP